MSLRNLLAAGIDDTFRGYLGQQYIRDAAGELVRLRPGGYERAIEQTLASAHNLSRYDPRIFREQVAPIVRQSLNATRRLNAGMPAGPRQVPWQAGDPQQPPGEYQYLVRGRMVGRDGTGRDDFLTVVRSATPLTQSQIEGRARTRVECDRHVVESPSNFRGLDSDSHVEWSTVSAVRVSVIG